MTSRLVLGCGAVGELVVERLDRDVLVIEDDPELIGTLREEGVPAEVADPSDRRILDGLAEPAVVCVCADEPARNRAIAEAAVASFGQAVVLAYVGEGATATELTAIEALADHTVDPGREPADRILAVAASEDARRAAALSRRLASIDGRLAVVAHDNPDPDAIASAVALCELAASVGTDADACYYGEIGHQENRAMVNLLELDLRRLEPDDDIGEYDAIAVVDHSRPGVNDGLPEDLDVEIVIDHHPPRGPVPGAFRDLRERLGATSTMLAGYGEQLGHEFDRRTATALLYGIRVDTDAFTRECSPADFAAAAGLLERADADTLCRITSPTVDGETYDTIARAIKRRVQRGSVVAASAGRIGSRDALPQAAETLLGMAGVETTLVFGLDDGTVYVSARSRAPAVDLGESLREAYGAIGSAGGHADMAGAQLEVGILGEDPEDAEVESILDVVEEVLIDRFFEAIERRPGTAVGVYDAAGRQLFGPEESV